MIKKCEAAIRIVQIAILIIISFIFIGCETYLSQEYAYKDPEISYEWGKIDAALRGAWRSIGADEIYGSPYDFFIGVQLKDKSDGFAIIKNIELIDIDKKQIVFEYRDDIKEEIFRGGDGYYKAIFLIKKLSLQFNQYKLTFDIEIETDKVKFKDKLEFTFEKDYKENRENLFWSILSSA